MSEVVGMIKRDTIAIVATNCQVELGDDTVRRLPAYVTVSRPRHRLLPQRRLLSPDCSR